MVRFPVRQTTHPCGADNEPVGGRVARRMRTVYFRPTSTAQKWIGNKASSYPGSAGGSAQYTHYGSGIQDLVLSKGHPFQKIGKGPGDIGGSFCVIRRNLDEANHPVARWRTNESDSSITSRNYLGGYYAYKAAFGTDDFPAAVIADSVELGALGTTAIARCIPTNPLGGLLVTLGELRSEGLPMLVGASTWQERASRARGAGKEYLNAEFGWRPLLSEIQGFVRTARRSDEIIAKYRAESGKPIHRDYSFPVQISTSESESDAYPDPSLELGYWQTQGKRTTKTTTRVETWFRGCFTYHLPPQRKLGVFGGKTPAEVNKLFGTRLTPETLWNLTPWSWAADWFTNLGDVVHNVSAFMNDGLVMPYAYIMRKREVRTEWRLTGAETNAPQVKLPPLTQIATTTVKQREKASPFGFGLEFGALSTRQKAILAALGLSRGSSGMRYD